MTKRLYFEDTWQDACDATVLECAAEEGGYAVLLDQTVLFPEGGGQIADTGSINGIPVTHVREDGEAIYHHTAQPIAAGTAVHVCVDMEHRRDHSAQHTGEHILSGLASKLYGAHNVGFHMAEDYATIDLDTALSDEQLLSLERAANRAVQQDLPIRCRFVEAEELDGISLRKRAKGLTGHVRIVYVDEGAVDSCTCCGTHCNRTGEVGYIKLTASQNYKGGVRLWFACGMRAVNAAIAQSRIVNTLARRFSGKVEDVCDAVLRQGDELTQARHILKERTDALLQYRSAAVLAASETVGKVKLALHREDGLSMADLKAFAEKLTAAEPVVAVLFSQAGDTLYYQLAASAGVKLSMREVCNAVNAATGGKGGGKESFAQGSAKSTAALAETIEQLRVYLRAALKNR